MPGAAEGMPEITPVVGFKINPDGSCPDGIDQTSGGEPPVATSCPWYGVSTVPSSSELVLMVSGPEGFTVMVKVGLMKYCSMELESTTSTTKEEDLCTVGVPEITPVVACNTSPAGRLPV